MNTALILQLLLIILDTVEPLTKPKLTAEQRKVIRDARKAAVREALETE